ncbi:hypothetical protein [Mesorhizobium sp. L48C026A00]|uniref:hypothetical protein n=1 Tax=Mesorhizobium sp. L48C026A00 TaxID=1287182 RepID=UPI0003D008CD|nr:hypothetical protein [Mesorhizobium sp. L48C026A00]ESZ15188.1 hypothetical protein X737_23030 [Mesorhizobium sp. L48C026A00]
MLDTNLGRWRLAKAAMTANLPRKGRSAASPTAPAAAMSSADLRRLLYTVISTDREVATSSIAGLASSGAGQYILID